MGAREKLLGAKVPTEKVYVKELDETYTLRGMTGAERDAFEWSCFEGKGKRRDFTNRNMRAKLVACCCIDDQGQRVFSDEDVVAIGEARADILDRLFAVAQRLSGLRQEDVDELGLSSATPSPSATSSSALH